jgi:hypothetical protein
MGASGGEGKGKGKGRGNISMKQQVKTLQNLRKI